MLQVRALQPCGLGRHRAGSEDQLAILYAVATGKEAVVVLHMQFYQLVDYYLNPHTGKQLVGKDIFARIF